MRLAWLILANLLAPHTDSRTEAAMTDVVVVTDESTREDIAEAIGWTNGTAKNIRRKGFTGTASAEYARIHGIIDNLLTDWQNAPS